MRALVDKLFTIDDNRNPLNYQEIFGTSDETKPTTGLISGSTFTEVDTGDIYMFNEDASAGSEWVLAISLQG